MIFKNYESKLAADVKSNSKRFFAYLKQRIVALRADCGAVVPDSLNMARTLANWHTSVYRTDEGRDPPLLPEPLALLSEPHFTKAAVLEEVSILDTAKGPGPDKLHPFMLRRTHGRFCLFRPCKGV